MKKLFLTVLCIAMSALVIACSPSSTPKEDNNSKTADESSKTDESDCITKEYKGLSFEIPSDSEYTESDNSAVIVFEADKKMVTIIPTDTSKLDNSLSDSWNDLSITSILGGFEEVQNKKESDTTLSEIPAKETTALVKLSGKWFSYSIVSAVREDYQYQYSICYATSEDAGTDNSSYEAFIKSISFK